MDAIQKYIIGVDIGGTWIRVALASLDLKVGDISIKHTRTLKEHEFSISSSVISLIREFITSKQVEIEQVVGIGIATAGPIDKEKGEVFNNANLGFKIVPLKKPIEIAFPNIPLFIINDANAAVLAVHYFEAEDDEKDNFVYITKSTGIGGGVICNGRLLLGKEGNAAEIGHGIVEPKSPYQCNCGAFGCWEVYSSGTGIAARAKEMLKDTLLNFKILMYIVKNDENLITAKEIFQAARGGDKFSKSVIEQSIFYDKIGIGLVNNYYDCTTIYFGGALMKDHDLIIPALKKQLAEDPVLFTINNPPKLKVTKYIEDLGVMGALAFIKYCLEGNPIIE